MLASSPVFHRILIVWATRDYCIIFLYFLFILRELIYSVKGFSLYDEIQCIDYLKLSAKQSYTRYERHVNRRHRRIQAHRAGAP